MKVVRIAVLDSGWDQSILDERVHPSLSIQIGGNNEPQIRHEGAHDTNGHGTAIVHRIWQVAPEAQIVPIRILNANLQTTVSTLIAAIEFTATLPVDIVNLSLGTRLTEAIGPLYARCQAAMMKGIVLVAAGHTSKAWNCPAVFDNVIGVGTDPSLHLNTYRYCPESILEFVASGDGPEKFTAGGPRTSFAAAIMSGHIANILSRTSYESLDTLRLALASGSRCVGISRHTFSKY